jgi:hypothetical protein
MHRNYQIIPPSRSVVLSVALAVDSVGARTSAYSRIRQAIVIVGDIAGWAVAESLPRKCRIAEAQARLDRCRRTTAETKLRIVSKGGSC